MPCMMCAHVVCLVWYTYLLCLSLVPSFGVRSWSSSHMPVCMYRTFDYLVHTYVCPSVNHHHHLRLSIQDHHQHAAAVAASESESSSPSCVPFLLPDSREWMKIGEDSVGASTIPKHPHGTTIWRNCSSFRTRQACPIAALKVLRN